jgi:tetratricopeptide (TPR) repeat protein
VVHREPSIARHDLAMDDLDVVIQLSPDPSGAYALRGLCRSVVGQFAVQAALDSALADVGRATQQKSLQSIVRLTRGIVAVKRGNYDQAVSDLSWAIDHIPDDTMAHCHRGYAFMVKSEVDRALADFDHAIKQRGDLIEPWFVVCRGECRAAMGKFDSAISDFTAAIKRDPDRSVISCDMRFDAESIRV